MELGTYYLQNVATGKYLSLSKNKDADGTAIILEDYKEVTPDTYSDNNNTSKYVFKIEQNGSTYSLQPANSTTRNIGVTSAADGVAVKLTALKDNPLQKWVFYKVSDGVYSIRSTKNGKFALNASGTTAKLAAYNATSKYQQWKLIKFTLKGAGTDPDGTLDYGIDVSEHQGELNWEAIKEYGVKYAIIRIGYGDDKDENGGYTQDDKRFEYNASECARLGIPFGVYIYSYAENTKQAKSEAEHVLRVIKGHSLSYPVYYDLEDPETTEKCTNSEILSISKTFESIITKAGYEVGFYANTWWWNNKLKDAYYNNFSRWVAQYNDECTYDGDYDFWQFTSQGYIPGTNGYLDVNASYLKFKSYTYTGKAITPLVPRPVVLGKTLEPGVDYYVSYENNVNAGIATAKIIGINNYKNFSDEYRFVIMPRSIKSATVADISAKSYTGKKIIPSLNITYGGKKLVLNKDYTVEGKDNKYVGTATITISGIGNYAGIKTQKFTIKKLSMKNAKISGIKDKVYNGKARTLSIKVKTSAGVELARDKSYTVTYKNNVNFGTATVTIKGKGKKYNGTYTTTYNIIPNTPEYLKVTKRTKTTITLNWGHVDYATRYQIYRSTSKNGKYTRVYSTPDRWTYTFKDTGLKEGTHYYYKVRAYKKVNGKKYYGEWSDIISTKTRISDTTFTIKKANATSAKITIKKDKSVTGYIVYMYNSKTKSYEKVWSSAKSLTYTKTGLKKGKTYKFLVRTYKNTPNGKIYGKKANPKSIKM